jgi:hypothetical protein
VVERGEGSTREEGSILFTNGQPVEARVNQQSGSAAFNYLSTWQRCHFSFVSHTINKDVYPRTTQPLPGRQGDANNGTLPERPRPQQTPQNGFYPSGKGAESSFPKRLLRGEEALQHLENTQLPRTHRRLLLLIDGRRSISELARLMMRDRNEVQKLLDDLEHAGLIRQ